MSPISMRSMRAGLLTAAIALTLSLPAKAQPGATPAAAAPASTSKPAPRPDPLDAQATVPATRHHSALQGYRPNAEQAVGSWKDANDGAGRAGGWRAYAREAHTADPPATAAATQPPAAQPGNAAPAASKPGGQGAHGKH
ncbi:MAG: hypothetical protein OEY03_10070 [Rhizobacter sp.]|nr:hypothetical protein [Rhizobacter sp.]